LLTESAEEPSASAVIWNDLAAALMARYVREGDAYDLVTALKANSEALRVEPTLPEALFNRGLLLEASFAPFAARAAWQHYLASISEPGWSDEARRHLSRLDGTPANAPPPTNGALVDEALSREATGGVDGLVTKSPQAWRSYLEGDLLAAWVQTLEVPDAPAAKRLQVRARAVAEALQRRSGDRLPIAAVTALASADDAQRLALVRGHRLFAEGLALYRESSFEAAAERFAVARGDFVEGGSPFAAWADLHLAICEYQLKAYGAASERLIRLRRQAEERGYLALAGRTAWITGLLHSVTADPTSTGVLQRASPPSERPGIWRRLPPSQRATSTFSATTAPPGGCGTRHWRPRRHTATPNGSR
jgi:hypothetical protein